MRLTMRSCALMKKGSRLQATDFRNDLETVAGTRSPCSLQPVACSPGLLLRHDDERLDAAPQDQQRRVAARANLVQLLARLRRTRHRLAVDLQDDVACRQHALRRAARLDVKDDRA